MRSDGRADRMIGAVFGGAYQITGLLAEGGMGWVFEARHVRLNKRVAVKLMARELAANPEALARFHREAEVTSQLGHPHLVNVVDFGTTGDGEPYLVMEYLDGEDLERRLRHDKRLPLEVAVRITRQVASALGAAHAEGIVHRDLTPGNVFLVKVPDEADFVKVLDFGISKIKAGRTKLTRANAVLGTPEYMSPEQANGLIEDIDHRVDQWALACIAWEMLSGYSPFVAEDVGAVFYRIINTEPHPLSARAPDLPPTIEPVLRRALSKRVAARYPSIKEFSRAFESAAMGKPVDATPLPIMSVSRAIGAPVPAVTARVAERPVTLRYGETPMVRAGSSQPGMAMAMSTPEAEAPTNASTFEARVLWSTDAESVEHAFEDAPFARRSKSVLVTAMAAGLMLAVAVLAFRPRGAAPTAIPAHEARFLPVVRALPEQTPKQVFAPAAALPPLPIAHAQRRAVEDLAPSGTRDRQPLSRTGVPGRGDHKAAPKPAKQLEAVESPSASDPFQADPSESWAAPVVPEPGDPFEPDKPAAKKAAPRRPGNADPFETDAAPAKRANPDDRLAPARFQPTPRK
jgi:serine/threonine protein kinase